MPGEQRCLWLALALALYGAACDENMAATPDSGPPAALAITELKLEENSHNTLSLWISWKTNRPTTAAVEFGKGGVLTHRTRGSAAAGLEHKVLVIGLHELTAYSWRAVSHTGAGEQVISATKKYTTRAQPAHIPYGKVTVHDPRRAWDGWTLMSVNACVRSGLIITWDQDFPPTAVMYDMAGRPVWYNAHGLGRIGDARYYSDGKLLFSSMADVVEKKPSAVEVDLSGKILWTGPTQPFLQVDKSYHHHFERLPGGTYLTATQKQIGKTLGDLLVELDSSHKVLWSWSSFDHLRPDITMDTSSYGVYAWTHINAMVMDSKSDWALLGARNLSTIFKIRKSTGRVLWALGEGRDFAADPEAEFPWFQQPHGLERLPNGNLIMLDNGHLSRGWSRAVEYAIDEKSRTSRIVWQYRGAEDERFYSNYWGDADRLPNGNTLISVGTWKTGASSRFFEVTQEGRKVWEMQLPPRPSTGTSVGAYNSQRLTPPLLKRIAP